MRTSFPHRIKFCKFSGNQLSLEIFNLAGSQVVSELYEYLWVITREYQLVGNQPADDHLSNSVRKKSRCRMICAICVASFADFKSQAAGIMDIHLAVWHVDAAPENHVSAPDVHRLKTVYRIL